MVVTVRNLLGILSIDKPVMVIYKGENPSIVVSDSKKKGLSNSVLSSTVLSVEVLPDSKFIDIIAVKNKDGEYESYYQITISDLMRISASLVLLASCLRINDKEYHVCEPEFMDAMIYNCGKYIVKEVTFADNGVCITI